MALPPTERFSGCVSDLFLLLQDDSSFPSDSLLPLLERLANAAADAEATAETPDERVAVTEMHGHCLERVSNALLEQCRSLFTHTATEGENQDDMQGHAAQTVGLALQIFQIHESINRSRQENSTETVDSSNQLTKEYASFQKETLRNRCKPQVAALVKEQRKGTFRKKGKESTLLNGTSLVYTDDDNPSNEEEDQQYHTAAVSAILEQSIRLVHPLLAWQSSVQVESPLAAAIVRLCDDAISTLYEQTQQLIDTVVGEWFVNDRHIQEHLETANGALESLVNEQFDSAVAELASISHMLSEYEVSTGLKNPSRWTEWRLQCSVLQRHWLLSHYHAVRENATPMTVVTDSAVQSSSVVEDAALLSTVALEKAVDVADIAYILCMSVWNTEDEASVYSALRAHVGCAGATVKSTAPTVPEEMTTTTSPPKSGDFAAALLEAMDEQTIPVANAPSVPSTFLSNLLEDEAERQFKFDTLCRLWNSLSAASNAVRTIRDSALEADIADDGKSQNMMKIVSGEMATYITRYGAELTRSIHESVTNDPSWEKILAFFSTESYLIRDENQLLVLENEARLQRDMLQPLQKSLLLQQVPTKCDDAVQSAVWEEVLSQVARVLLSALDTMTPHSVTDWGALLFSKQARMLQEAVPTSAVTQDAALPQVLTLLQLERPADWLAYSSSSTLEVDTVRRTMAVRSEFSEAVIESILATAYNTQEPSS